jgi:hypothetical protein
MKDFIFLHVTEFFVLVGLVSLLINLLLRFKWLKNIVEAIIDDTLKVYETGSKRRRFSGTKVTMMVAFGSVLWAFHYITIREGFNDTAFITMACIATGVAITGAYSKKLDPTIVAPDTQTTITQEKTGSSSETIIKESSNEQVG